MITKYEKLKIASNLLGPPMTKICDASPSDIRNACLNSKKFPELTKRIDGAIEEANINFRKSNLEKGR